MDSRGPTFWHRFARRPGIFDHALAALWLVGVAYAASHVEMELTHFIALFFSAALVGGLWALRGLFQVVLRLTKGFGDPLTRREAVAWLVLPAVVVVAFLLVRTEAPMRARFALSRAALTEYAESLTEQPAALPGRLGLYRPYGVEYEEGGVYLFTCSPGIFDQAGFAYFPDAPPTDHDSVWDYRPMGGPWWRFTFRD